MLHFKGGRIPKKLIKKDILQYRAHIIKTFAEHKHSWISTNSKKDILQYRAHIIKTFAEHKHSWISTNLEF
ncbi:hypothetical protein RchiOBHm_Chr7g0226761 [Rosa chinensis]|uniref:Uncharacterized protein n=1 Tax=Rosa chinensis TaxID=74649 RepID=A0A2P6PEF7_ROSCH|nr:hypothetical protein RchiOBHm_Chr7g0226761 [Rosa chinensis]